MKKETTKPVARPASSKNVQRLNKSDFITAKSINHSTDVQRQRVLKYLKENSSATTIDFRTVIDVLHPAARIMELRKRGHNIITTWDYSENPGGSTHRIGRYTLMSNSQEAA